MSGIRFKILDSDGPLLAQLKPAWRSVLANSCKPTDTYADVARVLDLPIGTVKSRLHRARAALQKLREQQQ